MPAFIVIIYVGIIGAAILYKVREDQAAQAVANAQPNGNAVALEAASDFDPLIEADQEGSAFAAQGLAIPADIADNGNVLAPEIAPFTETDAEQDPSTANLS
jgi:hypothetical protein